MANVLNVYFNAELAGALREEKGRLYFHYASAWLRSPDFVPLSIPLPPSPDEYGDDVVRPFFENLLPEGEIRSAVARLKQVSENNTFGLLEEIGGDCAGAISLLLPESARRPVRVTTIRLKTSRLRKCCTRLRSGRS